MTATPISAPHGQPTSVIGTGGGNSRTTLAKEGGSTGHVAHSLPVTFRAAGGVMPPAVLHSRWEEQI